MASLLASLFETATGKRVSLYLLYETMAAFGEVKRTANKGADDSDHRQQLAPWLRRLSIDHQS